MKTSPGSPLERPCLPIYVFPAAFSRTHPIPQEFRAAPGTAHNPCDARQGCAEPTSRSHLNVHSSDQSPAGMSALSASLCAAASSEAEALGQVAAKHPVGIGRGPNLLPLGQPRAHHRKQLSPHADIHG